MSESRQRLVDIAMGSFLILKEGEAEEMAQSILSMRTLLGRVIDASDRYRKSDLNQADAHRIFVDYKLWDDITEALK